MKRIKLRFLRPALLAGLLVCGLIPAVAFATPTLFNVNGTYGTVFNLQNGTTTHPNGTFSGTLGVDTSAGTITSVDIGGFLGTAAFTSIFSSQSLVTSWLLVAGNGTVPDTLALDFTTNPTEGSLVGFTGGTITDLGSVITSEYYIYDFAGTIGPASVSVPEPAALGMFGMGVLLIGLFVGLRRRCVQQA